MLVKPIVPSAGVQAATLFPSWRGYEPWQHRLAPVLAGLHARHPGLAAAIAALPFARFEAAHGPAPAVHKYNEVPVVAATLHDRLPENVRSAWLGALMIDHMTRFDATFSASGLPDEFALHYADAFHRILDQIEADPGFAVLRRDAFLKDLWLTRVVMLPAFAQLWWPRSGLSAKAVVKAGPRAIAHIFWRCGGRRPFMEGHTHDPVAAAYWNEPGWREALRLAALALPALPHLKGAFGTAWFYDPAVLEVSPRIGFAQALQVGHGAYRLPIGSNAAAIGNATATSPTRRKLFEEGRYVPTDYAVVWAQRDLIAAYG